MSYAKTHTTLDEHNGTIESNVVGRSYTAEGKLGIKDKKSSKVSRM